MKNKKYPRHQIRWRLQKRIALWIVHLGLFSIVFLSTFGRYRDNVLWIDSLGMSPYWVLLMALWFGLLMVHGGWVLLTYVRTHAVLREMEHKAKQQHELDLLQLKIELAQANNPSQSDSDSDYFDKYNEKPKRTTRLGDDGELIIDGEINNRDNHDHNRRM